MIILLVEDEVLIAAALEWALQDAGHEILGPVETIAEALGIVDQHKPDLALVNLTLKDGDDGAELARILLAQHHTPSIFITADVFHARKHRQVAMGMIKKPYDPEMVPAIVGYLDEMAQGRQPSQMPSQLEMFR